MRTETRKRALAALLLGVAIWPAFHYGLTQTRDVNPWKLFGWAMYTVPNRQVRVRVVPIEDGVAAQWVFAPAARDEIDRFVARRTSLGELADPRELGRRVLAIDRQFDELEVIVRTRRLDRSSARLVFDEVRERLRRGG